MAYVRPDGTPTQSGLRILASLNYGIKSARAVAEFIELPLPMVESGLHDLVVAGLAARYGETYEITERGSALLK